MRYHRTQTSRKGAKIVDQLVAALMVWIGSHTSYRIEAPPRIEFIPHAAIAEKVCGRLDGCAAMATYRFGGGTIYLDDVLDPLDEQSWQRGYAQSFLLHELVHYLQSKSGKFPIKLDCVQHRTVEEEAYQLQIRWLAEKELSVVEFRKILTRVRAVHCGDGNSDRGPLLGLTAPQHQ